VRNKNKTVVAYKTRGNFLYKQNEITPKTADASANIPKYIPKIYNNNKKYVII
jgi:hypothetical protein